MRWTPESTRKLANNRKQRIAEALCVLADLGMPRAQQNERSALCLLAILDLDAGKRWRDARNPLMGITPIMDWARTHYQKKYAPNTRETIRRQTMHHFVQAGIARYNPDRPERPVNSPHAVYQITPDCLRLLKNFGGTAYTRHLAAHLAARGSLAARYAMPRNLKKVPLRVPNGQVVNLSPGAHSELIRAIWEEFGPRFVPGGTLLYAGDSGGKWSHFDAARLASFGIHIDSHGKMPDVVIHFRKRNWLVLAEAVTSHGPVDAKRHEELKALFKKSSAGLVFVSAFPDRKTFTKYMDVISWETEAWIADSPAHLIHFNGSRFLGPY
jgi:BsuBI/PstI restriction endonuclease domain/BsuBI/PstI restriction endonuclease HTH domain